MYLYSNMMKKTVIGFIIVAGILVLSTLSCGKQKCGCEGEQAFTLNKEPGFIYYDTINKTATWRPKYLYGSFTICDAAADWSVITQFDSGEEVLAFGSVSDDCIRLTNPYAQGVYVLRLDTLELNEFGYK